jgi:hypothetical protein
MIYELDFFIIILLNNSKYAMRILNCYLYFCKANYFLFQTIYFLIYSLSFSRRTGLFFHCIEQRTHANRRQAQRSKPTQAAGCVSATVLRNKKK